MSKSTILVTGGTGFVGGHVVDQLLEKGYIVRAVVRPGREPTLRTMFPDVPKTQLQAIEISLLGDGDYSEALKGVDAVIHVAIPNPNKGATSEEVFDGVYNGTLHIVNSAIKAGIKKIVVSGSLSTMFDSSGTPGSVKDGKNIGSDSWGPWKTPEDCKNLGPFQTYEASKTVAERGLFEIAAKYRSEGVDITSIGMPAVLGPFPPNFPKPKSRQELGVHNFVYSLIAGGPDGPNTWPFVPMGLSWLVDGRDAAKAHILALNSPPTSYDKRTIVSSKTFTWPEIADLIRTKRPELAHRLPNPDLPLPKQSPYGLDLTLSQELLGMTEYIPFEETVFASLDLSLELEK